MKQNEINFLPALSQFKEACQTQIKGRVKFGSLDPQNSTRDSSSSLNIVFIITLSQSMRISKSSIIPPCLHGALSPAYTPYEITISCQNFEEALLLEECKVWVLPQKATHVLADGKTYVRACKIHTATHELTQRHETFERESLREAKSQVFRVWDAYTTHRQAIVPLLVWWWLSNYNSLSS